MDQQHMAGPWIFTIGPTQDGLIQPFKGLGGTKGGGENALAIGWNQFSKSDKAIFSLFAWVKGVSKDGTTVEVSHW